MSFINCQIAGPIHLRLQNGLENQRGEDLIDLRTREIHPDVMPVGTGNIIQMRHYVSIQNLMTAQAEKSVSSVSGFIIL